jgi:hypothetical protein
MYSQATVSPGISTTASCAHVIGNPNKMGESTLALECSSGKHGTLGSYSLGGKDLVPSCTFKAETRAGG